MVTPAVSSVSPAGGGQLFQEEPGPSGTGTAFLDDTWAWTAASGWQRLETPAAPPARAGMTSIHSPLNGGVLLFGGYDAGRQFGDTWLWKDGKWAHLPVPESPPGSAHSWMGRNPVTRHLVLFAPYTAGDPPANQIWRWDGSAWHMAGTEGAAPEPRAEGAFAYDPVRKYFLLFGGATAGTYYGDTWEVTCAHLVRDKPRTA